MIPAWQDKIDMPAVFIVTLIDGYAGCQGILIDPSTDVLMGGSHPREGGCAMGRC
jgi:hypothetical protein